MARRSSSPLDLLVLLPWWVGLGLAAFLFLGSGVADGFAGSNPVAAAVISPLAKVAALLCLFASSISVIRSTNVRRDLERQDSLNSLARLHWKQFEEILAEVFRRQGYAVGEHLGSGPDGGVDLVLRREGKVTLLQCKLWTGKPVGVTIVRELFGVMAAERADAGILVTTAKFTKECEAFARGKPIRLLDGEALLPLVLSVQMARSET